MKKNRFIAVVSAVILTAGLTAGCSVRTDTPVVGRIFGLKSNQIFQVDKIVCEEPEYKLVLLDRANQYRETFGRTVDWEVKVDEETNLGDYLMEQVKEELSIKYTLASMAITRGIHLAESEKESISEKAEEYFSALSEAEKDYTGADEQTVEELYKNFLLADKLYESLTDKIEDKVSEEEARVIQVQYIRMSVKTKNAKATLEKVAESVRKKEKSFSEQAKRYTEDDLPDKTLKKNEAKEKYEIEAFNLNNNEVSKVIQDGNNYYLVYCVNSYDEKATDENREKIVKEKKDKYFSGQYNKYLDTIDTDFNTRIWKKMELPKEAFQTKNLMSVYETIQ